MSDERITQMRCECQNILKHIYHYNSQTLLKRFKLAGIRDEEENWLSVIVFFCFFVLIFSLTCPDQCLSGLKL